MELHVWGHGKEVALIDAECVASAWFLGSVLSSELFTVVTSSNTDLSHSGRLPSLRLSSGESIDGYLDIVRYVSEEYSDLDGGLSGGQRALNKGLLLYIQDNLQIITDYTLYLNKSNYEEYSRSMFRHYLPFPMQYNTPLKFRAHAKLNCQRTGLAVEDKTEIEQEMLKNVPTVSKVQQLKTESMIEEKLILKNSISNMKCLNQLKSILETILKLKEELGTSSDSNIFGGSLTTSDLLLLAHLAIITNPSLPDQFISTFVEKIFPTISAFKTTNLSRISTTELSVRPPHFSESPNLFNSIKHLVI